MTELPKLTNEQWHEYLERLTLHAAKKFRFLGWTAKHGNRTGPHGKEAQDIAHEAICKVLNGKRRYNQEAYPDFMDFLQSIVDSLIYHLVKSFESKRFRPMPADTTDQGGYEEIEFEGREPTPARICVNKDIAERVKDILAQEFKDDVVVKGILECFEADFTKSSDIAELLDKDVKDIYNAQKRLRRVIDGKLQNLKKEYQR